jgi:hypothetical protein
VNMSDAHRTLWLRTFLAKNYYVQFHYTWRARSLGGGWLLKA